MNSFVHVIVICMIGCFIYLSIYIGCIFVDVSNFKGENMGGDAKSAIIKRGVKTATCMLSKKSRNNFFDKKTNVLH